MKAKSSLSITLAVLLAVAWLAGCTQLLPRSDSQVAAEVQNKINADANLPNKQITIRTEKGTVTLSGFVGSEGERTLAASDAGAVAGVKTVINNLQVSATTAAVAPAPVAPAPVAAAPPMAAPPAVSEPAPAAAPAPRSARRTDPTATSPRRAPAASAQPADEYGATAPAPAASAQPAPAVPADAVANAAPAAPAAPVEPAPVTVPDGTVLNVRLIDGIDTSRSQAGEVFRGTLDTPVVVGDKVAIPADADVTGRIVAAKQAGHYAGQSALALELTQVSYNGKTYQISTEQFLKQGSSRGKRTAGTVGGGAAVGAILGGIFGGGKGAAIGATTGAGAGAGVEAVTKPEVIRLPSESLVTFKLQNAVAVTPSSATRARRTNP